MNQSHSIITDHIQSYRDGGIASSELGYYVAYIPVFFAAIIDVNEYTDK